MFQVGIRSGFATVRRQRFVAVRASPAVRCYSLLFAAIGPCPFAAMSCCSRLILGKLEISFFSEGPPPRTPKASLKSDIRPHWKLVGLSSHFQGGSLAI
jgi:hypothetical protein